MWPCGVVVFDPFGNDFPGLVEAEEQGLIEELVAHLAIEAFDIAILRGPAGSYVVPVNPVIPGPCKDGVRREFRAIV